MIDDRRWSLLAWLAVAAFTFGGCGLFRPSVTIAPIALLRAPHADPADNAPILLVHFYSRPELLAEGDNVSISAEARFCDEDQWISASPITVGGKDIGWQRHEITPAPAPAVYSFTVNPKDPWRASALDLVEHARPICVWVNLFVAYEFGRTSNVIEFSADEVAAAVKAKR